MRTLWHLQRRYIPNQYVIACKSRRILHCILRIKALNCNWPLGEIRWVVLASVDDPKYVAFISCSITRKVELLLVVYSQNDFDALNHVTCVIFSRISGLLDHQFPNKVLLTSVDVVCPNQIYHHPTRNFCLIIKIFHLLVLIRCPNLEKYSPVLKFLFEFRISPWSFTTPDFDPEPAPVTVRVVSQKFWLCL